MLAADKLTYIEAIENRHKWPRTVISCYKATC